MSNYSILKESIVSEIPKLMELEKGCKLKCLLNSDNYQLVINDEYEYFEFIDDENMRLTVYNIEKCIGNFKDVFEVLGKEPMLNDVLLWHNKNGRNKYSHFEVNHEEAYFSIYDGEETDSITWDLSNPYLKGQNSNLIEWLLGLC